MDISSIGVVGSGTMGTGIAESALAGGCNVTLVDTSIDAATQGRNALAGRIERAVSRGRLTESEAGARIARLQVAADIEALAETDLVVEAIFEDFDTKARLFGSLSATMRPDSLLATNTSSLRVDDLARHVSDPGRFLGMHYFVPAGVNRLVEIVRGAATAPATIDAAVAFARASGKEPLLCRDSNGFVVNRFFIPFFNEAVRIHDEGLATTAQIDEIARDVLMASTGPFFVINLSKPRICLNACRTLVRFGPFYEPAAGLVRHGEGDLPYEIEDAPPLTGSARDIVADRLRGAILLPVLQLLDEGVTTADGVDLGARLALRWDRPPGRMMAHLGPERTRHLVDDIAARYGMPALAVDAVNGGIS